MNNEALLTEGFRTSLINEGIESNSSYHHKLLSNRKEKIITTLRRELENCEEFIISVAFITESGITMLLEQLKKLEGKNIRGKILTGDYLNFTEPKALSKLLTFKNIEVKVSQGEKLHAKGFFFRRKNLWNLIIGSSNLTQSALSSNFEWNLKITSLENGKIVREVLEDFYALYGNLETLTQEDIERYQEIYEASKRSFNYTELKKLMGSSKEPQPNFMQREALENLKELRKKGKDKALLISATGTGKTYLSAFDVKSYAPKKMLFIAHRKNILGKSKKTFETLIKDKEMTIYEKNHDPNSDYVFAMVQTLNKEQHLSKFKPDHFDYIIIDEVHHSGAKTYQNIIRYFKPKFFLGMTATPERNDDFDIYKLFDHTIAYEIRLHDALRENLLCPFHYFGISDIIIDGKSIDDKSSIRELTQEARINHIIEKAEYYGYSGETLHGLIFVSRTEEAKILSSALNAKGLKTRALTSEDSEEKREAAIEQLENGELEYLITVDIFNEGIDIPCVNQVILLRPTDSAIVYIQQLGRGLRKNQKKEYVVILDFIGNYEKNFLIPTAISQNNSYDKDFMKRFIMSGTEVVPGESSIIFDEIVKEKIFENINRTKFSTKKNIEHDFNLLKKQLGRTPYLNDFFQRNMIEPSVILKYKKEYDEVLQNFEDRKNLGALTSREKNFLEFLSQFFTPAKRVHEIEILKYLLEHGEADEEKLVGYIENKTGHKNQKINVENALHHLTKEIFTSYSLTKTFEKLITRRDSEDTYAVNPEFREYYENNGYFRKLIEDLIEYNLNYVKKNYPQKSEKTMSEYKAYTKMEAFWNLNLDYSNGYQVRGYTTFDQLKKAVIFITMDDNAYENNFLDQQRFPWFSQNNRCLRRDGKLTAEGKIAENYYTIEVFAKKASGESFYYLGPVEKVLSAEEIVNEEGKPLVEYELKLKKEIETNLFNYMVKMN